MANTQYPQVVVACLMQEQEHDPKIKTDFMAQYEPLMDYIRLNYVATFITSAEYLNLKSRNRPSVVLIVTEEITKIHRVGLRSALAKYVEMGGSLIFCCWFATKSTAWGIDGVLWEFNPEWTVKEGLEEFVRMNLNLNPALQQITGDAFINHLEPNYAIKAVHIQGISVANRIYLPSTEEEKRDVVAIDPHAEGTPSAFLKHGRGHLGYVGDVEFNSGTQALILAMIQACAPAALRTNKQAFAGSSINPPTNLVHAAPPSKYNMARPVFHVDPSGRYVPSVRRPAPATADTTIHPVSKDLSSGTRPSSVLQDISVEGFKKTLTEEHPIERSRSDDDKLGTSTEHTKTTHSYVSSDPDSSTKVRRADSASNQQHPQTISSESTVIVTCDTVNEENLRENEMAIQIAEHKAGNDTTPVHRAAHSVASERIEESEDEDGGVPVGTMNVQDSRSDPFGAALSAGDSDTEIGSGPAGSTDASIKEDIAMPSLTLYDPGCAVCSALTPAHRCSSCRIVQYCSQKCQAKDWAKHKVVCASNAGKDQKQGEVKVSKEYLKDGSFEGIDLYGSD